MLQVHGAGMHGTENSLRIAIGAFDTVFQAKLYDITCICKRNNKSWTDEHDPNINNQFTESQIDAF